jgi:hypothetical protein
MKHRAQAVFNERMELGNFPWDIQELSLPVTLHAVAHHARFVANQEYPSVFQNANFPLNDVFHVPLEDVVMACPHTSSPSESSGKFVYPRCTFKVYMCRKGGYYLSNVMAPMAVLTMLSMVSCSTEPSGEPLGTGDRLSVTLTLLLTAVAYKFVVASSLPQVWCVCMHTYTYIHTYIHTYAYMHTYAYINTYVCMNAYIYTYTYIVCGRLVSPPGVVCC